MVAARANRSVHRFPVVRSRTVLPFSSATTMGVAETPSMLGTSICSSGKARPMPSASISGRPVRAATTKGIVELMPPASPQTMWVTRHPRWSCSASRALTASSPRGSFSTITVGAPIIADWTTTASSGTSAASTSVTGPFSRTAWRASSLPMYGLPPPPVPRTAAPLARSSRSSSPTSRAIVTTQRQVADGLDPDPDRVAGQVGQRHLLDVDNLDARCQRPGGDRLADGFPADRFQRVLPRPVGQRDDLVDFAADLGDGGADGVGDGEMIRLEDLRGTLQAVFHQDAAASHDDDRQWRGARLDPVD